VWVMRIFTAHEDVMQKVWAFRGLNHWLSTKEESRGVFFGGNNPFFPSLFINDEETLLVILFLVDASQQRIAPSNWTSRSRAFDVASLARHIGIVCVSDRLDLPLVIGSHL